MRTRWVLTAALALIVLETFAVQRPLRPPPALQRPSGRGIIEVQVKRFGTVEGIPDVAVILKKPIRTAAEQVAQLFVPSPSLSNEQRQKVDETIQSALVARMPAEVIAAGAAR